MSKKTQKLAFFLFKDTVTNFNQCIENWSDCDNHDIKPQFGIEGKVFIGKRNEDCPDWVGLLDQGSDSNIDKNKLINSSSRAVIIVKAGDRFLAITFGFGRYLLNDEYLDRTFGLKVVLNTVNHKKLKTVELATLSDNTVITKKQSTRNSSKAIFGYEALNDLLCAVSGEPNDIILLGKKVSGREQLIIAPKMDFTNLKDICDTVLAAYSNDVYKKEFSWIDDIAPVKDTALSDLLDNKLTEALKNSDLDFLDITLPEVIDDEMVDGYTYLKNGEVFPEPNINNFLASITKKTIIDVRFLKQRKLWVQNSASSTKSSKWRIYDCLNFQTEQDDRTYILFAGHWYCIDDKFANKVQNAMDTIIKPANHFFNCSNTWKKESQYNQAFANSDKTKYVLLDMHLVKCENARTTMEPCDVFGSDGTFYHIKPKSGSSSLSHLFSQGKIAGEAFLKDHKFRVEMKRHVRKEKGTGEHLDAITSTRPVASNYNIVFGIIDSSTKSLKDSLPFFSQLNLMLAYEHLSGYGYNVSAVKIQKH